MHAILVALMIRSVLAALAGAAIAILLGSGFLIAFIVYTMVGSSTLLMLAAWQIRREFF